MPAAAGACRRDARLGRHALAAARLTEVVRRARRPGTTAGPLCPPGKACDTAPCAAQCLDMISRRDHAQRQRGTCAKSRARAHTHTHTPHTHTHTQPEVRMALGWSARARTRDGHVRESSSDTALGTATRGASAPPPPSSHTHARRHDATRCGHPTVARIWCHGASERAGSDGSDGEGGATAAGTSAAQRQPSQLGRR